MIERTTSLDWLLLTKRPENVNRMVEEATGRDVIDWFVDNSHVWIGTTVEDQRRADERIPHLRLIPACS
ncbi:DUF5131 family protein, partial [Klebsiella pneumoniae]|uniref:DUF5131 family protein n=1 Tax=Klebsiella pneumoniae TaxID=573 RepID=UPI00272EEF0E